jgi:hypothetical protein
MIPPKYSSVRGRGGAFLALALSGAALAIFACSSDPANTLGSEGDLLGSEPGDVYQDTIGIFDDTTYVFNTTISTALEIETGVDSLYEHIMVLMPGFAELDEFPGDRNRTVLEADLHLGTGGITGNNPVRFYGLNRKYTDGDTLSIGVLDDADAILDPDAGSIERSLQAFPQLYPISPALAQSWVRADSTREAIAIVYTNPGNEVVLSVPSEDASDDQPYLQVRFTDGTLRSYDVRDACTVYRPRTISSPLTVSDGYPRRVFMRTELDSLADDASVHSARMKFHIVPETLAGSKTTLLLYIPDSTDPATPEFKNGQRIIEVAVTEDDDIVEFPLTNALFLVLQGTLKNNGFAIRFKDENTLLRHIELYGNEAPDSLRPQVFVTTSRPAVFE